MKERKGSENAVADHLSRIPLEHCGDLVVEKGPVEDDMVEETLIAKVQGIIPWFADFANYLASGVIPDGYTSRQRRKFFKESQNFFWEDPYLFKRCPHGIFRRCIPEHKVRDVLEQCHTKAWGGHGGCEKTVSRILQGGLFRPL